MRRPSGVGQAGFGAPAEFAPQLMRDSLGSSLMQTPASFSRWRQWVGVAVVASCSGASPPSVPASRLSVQLTAADYVLPAFSPSGRFLALSQVLVAAGSENTQIVMYDFVAARLDTLLSASQAQRYATYKAYVSALTWVGDSLLVATIPDGDVDATEVVLDVRSRQMLRQRLLAAGSDEWPPPYQSLAESLVTLYPTVAPSSVEDPSRVFGSGLDWPTVRGPSFIVLQKRFAQVDNDVWLYHLDHAEAVRIVELPNDLGQAVAGGFSIRDGVLLAVGAHTIALIRWRRGALDTLARIPARPQSASLAVRAQRGDSVWFILRTRLGYERGHSPAWLYDGQHLTALGSYTELHDFDLHLPTGRVAFVFWSGNERHVALTSMDPP